MTARQAQRQHRRSETTLQELFRLHQEARAVRALVDEMRVRMEAAGEDVPPPLPPMEPSPEQIRAVLNRRFLR